MTTRELLENFTREEGIALFNTKKTDKEIYDILVAKGLTDSFEIFTAEAEKVFAEKVSQMSTDEILTQIDGAELTDDQLEMVAGGKDELKTSEKVAIGMGALGVVSAIGVASVAAAF